MEPVKRLMDQLLGMPAGTPGEVRSVEGNIQVAVKLADRDRLGCLLEGIELKGLNGARLTMDPARLAERITYLGETLHVVESEEFRGRFVLRSSVPREDGDRTSFYEVILDRAEGLSLVRYAYDRGERVRTPVPAAMSRESLERLLGDLFALAGKN